MQKIKILAITGIRSEYDILYPVIDTLRNDERFDVKVAVSGAHLSNWHGHTLEKIENDGFNVIEKIDTLLMTNRKTQRAKGVGILTYSLSQTVEREAPDFMIVVGDREESIASAIVANYMEVLIAHIGGGDPVYGNADDPIRFAVSKLAHIHFTTADEYANNLLKLGEEKFRIFNVGNPALDNIKKVPDISLEKISCFLNCDISDKKYVVLIQHPLSSEKDQSYNQMSITLTALDEFCSEMGFKAIVIYPNTDPGSYDVLNAIDDFKGTQSIKFYKTLPRDIFINVIRNTKAIIGNSSMGLLEAPFYKLPVVNIGNRQKGRLNAGNVDFVNFQVNEIREALIRACFDETYRDRIVNLENPFGDGNTSENIKKILLSIDLNDLKWYVKRKFC